MSTKTISLETLKYYTKLCENDWGNRPHLVLACSSGLDEHWQIYNQKNFGMPHIILSDDHIIVHPDSPFKTPTIEPLVF